MTWLYHIKRNWNEQGYSLAQHVLLRAFDKEEESVSNIIEIYVFAMDFYFNLAENPLNEPKYQQIFYEELEKKDYFVEELEIGKKEDYMLKRVALYLKAEKFYKAELMDWVRTCLSIWGFAQSDFEERDMSAFAETDELLRLFSLENAKKFESKFGKEWWKKKD